MSDNKKFATLDSLGGRKIRKSGSSDDDEGRQGFYVGGSERSGQQVLGPAASNNDDLISQFFTGAARSHSAVPSAAEDDHTHGGGHGGSGYRLGDAVRPSELVTNRAENDGRAVDQNVELNMWMNGFSIDGGPLRQFDDPANHAFLESVMNGRMPIELARMYPGKVIDLHIHRKQEAYKAPPAKPFSGKGQRLGEIPVETAEDTMTAGATSAGSSRGFSRLPRKNEKGGAEKAQEMVKLKEGEPTGKVQIRLPDGSRMIAQFNPSNVTRELYNFVANAVPALKFAHFTLMTSFPSRKIESNSDTLGELKLLNSVVLVKTV